MQNPLLFLKQKNSRGKREGDELLIPFWNYRFYSFIISKISDFGR